MKELGYYKSEFCLIESFISLGITHTLCVATVSVVGTLSVKKCVTYPYGCNSPSADLN